MPAIKRLKHLLIMLFATITTIFLMHFGNFPAIAAAISGALSGFGLLSVINYSNHASFED